MNNNKQHIVHIIMYKSLWIHMFAGFCSEPGGFCFSCSHPSMGAATHHAN